MHRVTTVSGIDPCAQAANGASPWHAPSWLHLPQDTNDICTGRVAEWHRCAWAAVGASPWHAPSRLHLPQGERGYISGDTMVVDGASWMWDPPLVPRHVVAKVCVMVVVVWHTGGGWRLLDVGPPLTLIAVVEVLYRSVQLRENLASFSAGSLPGCTQPLGLHNFFLCSLFSFLCFLLLSFN
eukprot:1160378-Pelagomonas_calceolata.AAC.3